MATQHVPEHAPQSAEQVAQFSPTWHSPFPQIPVHTPAKQYVVSSHWQSEGQVEQSSPSEHSPSPQQPKQLLAAYSTQYSSHCTLQQNMSCAQTQASTSLTEQPGVSPSSQHSPPHVPHVSASSAHSWLQDSDSQHSGWVSQTHSATSKSLHALVVFAIQHEPLHPPQSVGQLRQSSPFSPSQIPLPQNVSHCPSTHC